MAKADVQETGTVVRILLDHDVHEALVAIAAQEGRSVSDVARELIQRELAQQQASEAQLDQEREARRVAAAMEKIRRDYEDAQERARTATIEERLAALEQIRQHREAILAANGGQPIDLDVVELIHQMWDEQDDRNLGLTSNRD